MLEILTRNCVEYFRMIRKNIKMNKIYKDKIY